LIPSLCNSSSNGSLSNLHRDYNPSTGRYLQSDPIGLQGGVNLFAYARGNPFSGIDPRGLKWGTSDFVKHYYTGGGRGVSLSEIGLLKDFMGHPSVLAAMNRVLNKGEMELRVKLLEQCNDSCEDATVHAEIDTSDYDDKYNTTLSTTLFSIGKGQLFNAGYCIGYYNCMSQQGRGECNINFYIRDRFEDPLDIGIEVGGHVYKIHGDWHARGVFII